MHEHTIAQKIIKQANHYKNIKSITVEVGELAHLPSDEMKQILERLTNWEIKIIPKKAIILCVCGHRGEPKILQQLHDNNIYECPKCSFSLPQILDGKEIILKEIEIEKTD